MKQLIQDSIDRLKVVRTGLDNSVIRTTADEALVNLASFINKHGFDSALGIRLSSLLQLSSDEAHISTFQLEDITCLFDALLKTFPDNAECFLEAAYFYISVLGDTQYGKTLAERAQVILGQKQIELKALIATIGN